MKKTNISLLCGMASTILAIAPLTTSASPSLAGGVWFNYANVKDNAQDEEDGGDIGDEALILYADDDIEDSPWSLSAELRIGPGSFTDPDNNSTGDQVSLHKAWINYQFDDRNDLKIGKSQVPFGWKTVNFWPGDHLLGGYADQMDVGAKYSHRGDSLHLDLAYYQADDWGATSTDTVDDNGHWGSSETYRKVHTAVANVDWVLNDNHTVGISAQSGRLQDLTKADNPVRGRHTAYNIHHYGQYGDFYSKLQWLGTEREDIPGVNAGDAETERAALLLGYNKDQWHYYFEAVSAELTDSNIDTATSYVPGMSYDYGPGWIYLEYLSQEGFIGQNGEVVEGEFDAFYASIDYYF
ncbi:MAG: porin [Pseudomonadota bacterium]